MARRRKGPQRMAAPKVPPPAAQVAVDAPVDGAVSGLDLDATLAERPVRMHDAPASSRAMSLLAVSQAPGQDRSVTLRWIETLGCPCIRRADRDLGHEWQLDLGDVVRWRVAHERKVVLSETGAGSDIEPKDRLILLKIAKEANLLVPVVAVEAVYERADGQARQAIMSASTRLARSMDGFLVERVSAWTLQADATS